MMTEEAPPWPPPAIEGKQIKEESVRIRRPIYDWEKEDEAPSH
jgi:hypothetical protein